VRPASGVKNPVPLVAHGRIAPDAMEKSATAMSQLLSVLVAAIEDRSAKGIASATGRLISSGEIAPGTRLPTVRAIAAEFGVSPARVDAAWRILAGEGVLETAGRRGTFVLGPRAAAAPSRWWSLPGSSNRFKTDLSTGEPDPALLPPLAPVVGRAGERVGAPANYTGPALLPELEQLLRLRYPPEPESVALANGGLDALDSLLRVTLRFGDRVLVEEPGYPPAFDLIEAQGGVPVPVGLDEEGILPDALAAALELDPRVLILQPAAQNPTGVTMSESRARQLAEFVRDAGLLVIEDDHALGITSGSAASLAAHAPDQTARVLSFSESYGPDLRLAAILGPARILERVIARRILGPRWASRLLQTILVILLESADTTRAVERAWATYAQRRARLAAELGRLGVPTGGSEGLNLWIPVGREREAVHALAAQSISVAPGAPFFVRSSHEPHIRVTSGLIAEGHAELAVAIAGAARLANPFRSSEL
jgi:DNA-binding transcriptional MocR family regulator